VCGGVQKVGDVKLSPPNPVQDIQSSRFSSETYKKVGSLRRKTPELALAILFDSNWRRESLERLNSAWIIAPVCANLAYGNGRRRTGHLIRLALTEASHKYDLNWQAVKLSLPDSLRFTISASIYAV
jgi:hypothetical protein